jgi:hypothetical protein
VALHARSLGEHAEGGQGRAYAAVKVHRGLDNPPPGVRLPLGAPLQRVIPSHILIAHDRASILTGRPTFTTHVCIIK